MDIVLDCINVVKYVKAYGKLEWWALENPRGRMRRIINERRGIDIGKWVMGFDLCEFAKWSDIPTKDTYTKFTCLWGEFTEPDKKALPMTHKKGSSPIHRASPGPDRWKLRSMTPRGFSNAFFHANR